MGRSSVYPRRIDFGMPQPFPFLSFSSFVSPSPQAPMETLFFKSWVQVGYIEREQMNVGWLFEEGGI